VEFNLRIADLVRDNAILYRAREIAETIIADDPKLSQPQHLVLKQQLSRLGGNRYDWGRIS
jgi:ATP-dependent DNA helicase RecG